MRDQKRETLRIWFFVYFFLIGFNLSPILAAKDGVPPNVHVVSVGETQLYHYSNGSDFVNIRIIILGGANNYLKKYEGIESLALDAMLVGGSKFHPRDSLQAIFEECHAQVSAMAGLDFSVVDFSCPQVLLEYAWPVFIRLVCYPSFETEAFKLIQIRYYKELTEAEKLPAEQLKRVSFERYLKGHPYERHPVGSVKALSVISREMVVSYYKALMVNSRIRIVSAGNLTDSTLEALASSFQDFSTGKFVNRSVLNRTFSKTQIASKQTAVSTCTIRGVLAAPPGNSSETLAAELLVALVHDKIAENLNSQTVDFSIGYLPGFQGLIVLEAESYNPYGFALLLQQQIQQIRSKPLPEEIIVAKKRLLFRKNIESFETGNGQIQWLTQGVVYNKWIEISQLEEKLQLITADQLQKIAKFWLIRWQWILLGNFPNNIHHPFEKIP